MQEVLDAIERHLGRSVSVAQLDYYQVIGLELYCEDPQRIRVALQEATNRWMQSETGRFPESAQIIAKLLKQAQIILIDPEKRQRYNIQLEKLRRSQAESKPQVVRPEYEDDELFPCLDPRAPFIFETAVSATSQRDLRCALLDQIHDPSTRLAELEQLFPSLAEMQSVSQAGEETERVLPVTAARTSGSKSTLFAQQILQRRRRRRIMTSLLLLFGSQAILGVSVWYYWRDLRRSESRNRQIADRQAEPGDAVALTLPKIVKPPEQPPPPSVKATPAPKPKKISSPPMVALPVPEEPMQAPPEDPAKGEETAEWKRRMANARAALDRADFESFEKAIVQQQENANTPLGRDQAERLDQLGQLYKIGIESFDEAKKKTHGSTSSLKVGGVEVNIVESTPEKLVLRSGENKTLSWDKLKFPVASALLDLTLDKQNPTDLAARAVFFSLAPQYRDEAKTSANLKTKIATWFDESVGKGKIRADLPQALTDSFD